VNSYCVAFHMNDSFGLWLYMFFEMSCIFRLTWHCSTSVNTRISELIYNFICFVCVWRDDFYRRFWKLPTLYNVKCSVHSLHTSVQIACHEHSQNTGWVCAVISFPKYLMYLVYLDFVHVIGIWNTSVSVLTSTML
jgi:hypothetical protein